MELEIQKFHPIFDGIKIGIGTWAWGDRLYWGFGSTYAEKDIQEAFKSCLENGILFFDTAEVYGQGKSELILGELIKKSKFKCIIASKIMPFPWRLNHKSFSKALKSSLDRLNLRKIHLIFITGIDLKSVSLMRYTWNTKTFLPRKENLMLLRLRIAALRRWLTKLHQALIL